MSQKSGKHWRGHRHLALEIGANQVKEMESHYARHGVHVDHRKNESGGYEAVVTSLKQFERLLAARGMVNRWGAGD